MLKRPTGSPQASQLLLKPFPVKGALRSTLERHGAAELQLKSLGLQHLQLQRGIQPTGHPQRQIPGPSLHRATGGTLPTGLPIGITGEPDRGASSQARAIHTIGPQAQLPAFVAHPLTHHDPATDLPRRLQRVGRQLFQHKALPGMQLFPAAQMQPTTPLHPQQLPQQRAPLLAPAAMHQTAMVHPFKPTGGKASGKGQLKLALHLRRRSGGLIQALAIGVGDGSHVGSILQTPFDLEAGHADALQLRQQLPGRQILGREEVALVFKGVGLPIHHHFVGQATGLGTLTSIGTALPERFTGQTLTGIGDAKGAMHKHLQRHRKVPLNQLCLQSLEITQGQLTGQHHPLATERRSLGNTRGTGDRHLG